MNPLLSITEQPMPTFKSCYRSDMKKSSNAISGINSKGKRKTYPTVKLNDAPFGLYLMLCSLCESDTKQLSPSLLLPETEYNHKPLIAEMKQSGEREFEFEMKNYFIKLTKKDETNILKSKYEQLENLRSGTTALNNTQKEHIANVVYSQLQKPRNDFCFSFTVFTKQSDGSLQQVAGPIYSEPFRYANSSKTKISKDPICRSVDGKVVTGPMPKYDQDLLKNKENEFPCFVDVVDATTEARICSNAVRNTYENAEECSSAKRRKLTESMVNLQQSNESHEVWLSSRECPEEAKLELAVNPSMSYCLLEEQNPELFTASPDYDNTDSIATTATVSATTTAITITTTAQVAVSTTPGKSCFQNVPDISSTMFPPVVTSPSINSQQPIRDDTHESNEIRDQLDTFISEELENLELDDINPDLLLEETMDGKNPHLLLEETVIDFDLDLLDWFKF